MNNDNNQADSTPNPNIWKDHVINPDGSVSPIKLTHEQLQAKVKEITAKQKAEGKTTCIPKAKTDNIEASDCEFDLLSGITNAQHLLTKKIITPPELIKGCLYKGGKMSINAPSKMGKTWTLAHLGLAMANGAMWLGLACTKSKVLFINPEIQNFSFEKRIQMIKDSTGITSLENFDYLTTRGKKLNLELFISAMEKKLQDVPYDVIIIDSIYKLLPAGHDENSNGDIGEFLTKLETLTKDAKCTIIYSHHFSKGNQAGKTSIDRSSGAGVFSRDPDAILTFSENVKENSYTVDFNLRDFKRIESFVVNVNFPNISRDGTANPKQLKTGKFASVFTMSDLIAVIDGRPRMSAGTLQKLVLDECGMSRRTFFSLWSDLKKNPNMSETREGWQYTEKN